MKNMIYRLGLLTGLLAAGSLGALAAPGDGEGEGRPPRGPGGPDREAILKEFDKDGDGILNEDERKAARAAAQARAAERRAAFIKQFDEDGDGKLNADERAKAAEARKAEREARLLKQFDADGNGKLNEEEQAKADEARERFQNRRRGGEDRGPGPEGRGPRREQPEGE